MDLRKTKITHEGKEYEIAASFSPQRLEGEDYETYKIRRTLLKYYYKMKRSHNLMHVSAMLIPETDENGNVIQREGRVNFIGKTKGTTYIKKGETNE